MNWKRRLALSFAALIGAGIVYAGFKFLFLNFFVDWWWFESSGYEGYFWMRLLYRHIIFASVTLIFFLIFFLNFWIASRYLGNTAEDNGTDTSESPKKYKALLRMFQSGSLKVYTPLSLILAVPIAIPLYEKWEEFLLFIFSGNSGITEPTFGKDISFYLFSFPIYKLIVNELFITFSLLLLFLIILYRIESRILSKEDLYLPSGARIHLNILFFVAVMIKAYDYFLQQYDLLYAESHAPLFPGPGFVEMNVSLPLIWAAFASLIATAIFLMAYIHGKKGLKPLIGFALLFLLCLGMRASSFLQENIERYVVKANQAGQEKTYIERSIRNTLTAYNIADVESHPVRQNSEMVISEEVRNALRNIPVWDEELIDDVYTQVQGMRSYYRFVDADADRYNIGGVKQQVYISAREINTQGLSSSAKNWLNTHLLYTHGYGVVMTPAAQFGDEPMKWLIHDIPLRSALNIKNPAIYYGINNNDYAIVPNEMGEIDHFENDKDIKSDYNGTGGVLLSSIFRKLLFAVWFKNENIFLTTKTKSDSRILFHRNIRDAVKKITPYFMPDKDPYIVATSEGLFWVMDAYTTSSLFPGADKIDKKVNYIRNSVKIVADAYHGRVNYYVADSKDPIVNAYRRMYPGLLKPMEQMPDDIRKNHLRYPRMLFELQMSVYAKYHQSDAESFYRQDDNWDFAKSGDMKSYYLTLSLFETDKTDRFILLCPMSNAVVGKDKKSENLRAVAIVGSDDGNYGKISVLTFSNPIRTPSQISSMIDQDTVISRELTLWGQVGSEVRRGRIIVLPVNGTVFYIQPVYLRASTGPRLPELKRIILSQGDIFVMERSLEEALKKIEEKLKERAERAKP